MPSLDDSPVAAAPPGRLVGPSTARACALVCLGLLAVVTSVVAGCWVFRTPLRAEALRHQTIETLTARLQQWATAPPPGPSLVFFGDSLTLAAEWRSIPALVATALSGADRPVVMVNATHLAFRPINFYELLDLALRGRPRTIVVEVNVRMLSEHVVPASSWRFASLSRYLTPARAWRVRAALAADDISLFDPFLYRGLERIDLLEVANGLRARADDGATALGTAVTEVTGIATRSPQWRLEQARAASQQLDADTARAWYGVNQAAHPAAAVLRQLVVEARAEGTDALLYVSPVDVDRLSRLGVRDEIGLPRRLAALRARLGVRPDEWLDLHDLLSHEEFLDAQNHLQARGAERVAERIAAAVAAGQNWK